MTELLKGMFLHSHRIILDFNSITPGLPKSLNIKEYFEQCEKSGVNPRSSANRQIFNDTALEYTKAKFLIGGYAEDRSAMLTDSAIAKEGRAIHMGVDVFSKDLELVYAPCDGRVVKRGYEKGPSSYGYYLTFKPHDNSLPYLFLGHLGKHTATLQEVRAGDALASLGDFSNDENGGWSRHLHLQMMRQLEQSEQTPIGYSSKEDLVENMAKYPDPIEYFPGWQIT